MINLGSYENKNAPVEITGDFLRLDRIIRIKPSRLIFKKSKVFGPKLLTINNEDNHRYSDTQMQIQR